MGTVSLNLFPIISSRPSLSINRASTPKLLRKKSSSTDMFFCVDQISKNFSSAPHSSANNRKNGGIPEKNLVSITKSQLSPKVREGLGIVEYFIGKKLLVTGATGFLAKGTFCYFHTLSPS